MERNEEVLEYISTIFHPINAYDIYNFYIYAISNKLSKRDIEKIAFLLSEICILRDVNDIYQKALSSGFEKEDLLSILKSFHKGVIYPNLYERLKNNKFGVTF